MQCRVSSARSRMATPKPIILITFTLLCNSSRRLIQRHSGFSDERVDSVRDAYFVIWDDYGYRNIFCKWKHLLLCVQCLSVYCVAAVPKLSRGSLGLYRAQTRDRAIHLTEELVLKTILIWNLKCRDWLIKRSWCVTTLNWNRFSIHLVIFWLLKGVLGVKRLGSPALLHLFFFLSSRSLERGHL